MAKLVFAGTPEFSVGCLAALVNSEHTVSAVYTQPDRRAGRGRQPQPSPVKAAALSADIPVYQPLSLREPEAQAVLREHQADLMVVVAYGLLLPIEALIAPRLGCINVHASLLPRWRGAAPIQRAIEAGDTETGVCIMQMDEGLDTGPVWHRATQAINADTTGQRLHDQLAQLGAQALLEALPRVLSQQGSPEPQSDVGACYAPKLHKKEADLDWALPTAVLEQRVRAFNPVPVAQTRLDGGVLRIWSAHPVELTPVAEVSEPGSVVGESAEGIDVRTGDGLLRVTQLQPAGKRPMTAGDYLNARSLLGQRFEVDHGH